MPIFAVRFEATVEITYYVRAQDEHAAMEFTPSEWPSEPTDATHITSYGEFQLPDAVLTNGRTDTGVSYFGPDDLPPGLIVHEV